MYLRAEVAAATRGTLWRGQDACTAQLVCRAPGNAL